MKLDIACGQNKEEGWVGIDLSGDADIVHDLFSFPWPIEDGSVEEIRCSHFVEHIPHYRPEWNGVDGWWLFWSEVYRILAPGGKATIVHPYLWNDRAFWDPTHVRFIHEITWQYLDAKWREAQKLDHYPVAVDFEIVLVTGLGVAGDIQSRAPEVQAFAREHYKNVVGDLQVELRSRKEAPPNRADRRSKRSKR